MSDISKCVIQAHDVIYAAVVVCRKCRFAQPIDTNGFPLGFFGFSEVERLTDDEINAIKEHVNSRVEELRKEGWVFFFGEFWQLNAECPKCWKAGGAV